MIRHRPCSIDGHELAGDNITRIIYLDEAGISNPKHEPFVVVAGVIIHADKQWKALENYLWAMLEDQFPPEERLGAYFHTKDIYGGGKRFSGPSWPPERRFELLDELVSLPQKFDLPIIWGCIERATIKQNSWISDPTMLAQVSAAQRAMMSAEHYMRTRPNDEVASVIMEDTPHVRRYVKEMSRFLRNPPAELVRENDPYLPLTRIIGTPHFEEKEDASPLQIADVCAFIIKRQMMKAKKIERFFDPLKGNLYFKPFDPEHPLSPDWVAQPS